MSAANMQSFCFNKTSCMCFCMHVALFDCDFKCVCRCLCVCVCVFCMHLCKRPDACVRACVFWMFQGWRVEGGGTVRAQNTEVGNILMSTAQQEIGNTFKSLALRTAFGSQGEITARARHRV